ncbi:hypothetical protein M9H77_02886 [Catharanthus roseus]|uniref:Uncharacterized protein n=1 Tax=Catharanthus roseus TaxID=4058 RepID=A0ACC0CA60_CATRO|nr:hypothetical protein M9H77_02886 [Catharanthus roseus]
MSTKPELATPLKENQLLAIERKILFSVNGRRKDEKKRALSQAAYSRTVRGSSKMDGVSGKITQLSLNSCTSRLMSSLDTFKGKKVGAGLERPLLYRTAPILSALRLGALPSDPVLTQSFLSLFVVVFVLGLASFGMVLLLRI